jgi:glycerophosphoryl diester phosphodiesterase
MCASPLRIGASTHRQLDRLRVGEGPIPTLRSLLELVAGRVPLLLEVKVDGDLWRWIPVLRRELDGYRGRYGVMSFDARLPRLLKTNLSAVRRGLVVRHSLSPLKRWLALRLASPDFLAVDKAALGEAWVARARKRLPVYSWAIDSAEQRRTASVHADALIWEADGRP